LAGHQLKFLERADRARSVALIDQLLTNGLGLLNSESGVRLLAAVHSWLPQEIVSRSIDSWLAGNWVDGPQAAAELAMLRYGLVQSDQHAAHIVEAILAMPRETLHAPQMRLGIAYLAAELWSHPSARMIATRVLIQLLPVSESTEATVWLRAFRSQEPPLDDMHTQQMLDAVADQTEILRQSHSGSIIDQLKGLLEQDREHQRVCRIVTKLISEIASAVGDIQTAWFGSADDLINIALTLQRFGPTRACGLDIFEKLLDADAYKISEALQLLDRRLPG